MTSPQKLNFRAHARLKDIVGRGLIMSDNIAIIELIKNSKDAGSPRVRIEFRRSDQPREETELWILDQGCGMSLEDIREKWLNIAYSYKKHERPTKEAYAGSKGIGRFSCDRLGSKLILFTKTKNGPIIELDIDWKAFEVDAHDRDINSVKINSTTPSYESFKEKTGIKEFKHGTILVIRQLRGSWNEDDLKSLRRELERFIVSPSKTFSVLLYHWQYSKDSDINAPIENKIFQELDFRTTSIQAKIVREGKEIHFELRHDGDFVFKSCEKNPYSKLKNVQLNLFFLNQPAKAFFKRKTGYRSVDYGSVFLFLNGFRVFPYGSFGDDWLGIQKRQAQGTKRFFGTRDLVGFIKVVDTADEFVPVSSREGLVRNDAFQQLVSDSQMIKSNLNDEVLYGFFHKAMRKLEKFVVEGLDWDRIDRKIGEDKEEELLAGHYELLKSEKPVFETIDSIVKIRSPGTYIKDVKINVKYLGKIAEKEIREYEKLVASIEKKFGGTPISKLKPSERRDLSKFISRQAKETKQKNQTIEDLEKRAQKTRHTLETEQKRRIFAEFEATADQKRILQLHHQVALIASVLHKRMDRILRKYRSNPEFYTSRDITNFLEASIFDIKKILSVAKLASKANFDISTNRVREDIVQFVEEYIANYQEISHGWGIKVVFANPNDIQLKKLFRPAEVTMLVDNIIDNAGKAGAKILTVNVIADSGSIMLQFDDNGRGLTKRFAPPELLERGITTTSGSGIGLSHVKQIVEDLKGTTEISTIESGVRISIGFKQ